ncbi:MAG: hypothetical protein H0T47_01930 [Planctomycetaceae bacterium]|nr:hypothetical protein [Planctomycetaceae bacterium]
MSVTRLRERRDLCRTLLELSDRQRAALAERRYDDLIVLLGEKRTLLDRLAVLSSAARNWAAERVFLSAADRAAGEELLVEGNGMLGEAERDEQQDIAELTDQRDATQAELLEISSAGRVHSAYRDALAPATHRSLDVDR